VIEALPVVVFLLLTAIPATGTIVLIVCAARWATKHVGVCRKCGYDLRQLGETRECPECGQPFVLDERGQAIS
jgi:hypothetical protein